MPEFERFDFERSRGIVWFCDLANSSRYLNDNTSADDLEELLPRLFWVSSGLVEAAGGRFIKWTGDGFFAWFETELHRTLGQRTAAVYYAASALTFLVNVTQLGLSPVKRFMIRHGVAYEQDARLIHITHTGGYKSIDLIGRGVVLASRLASIGACHPNIVTQGELVRALDSARDVGYNTRYLSFRKWQPTPEDRLRFFKGERWGTQSIYISTNLKSRVKSASAVVKQATRALKLADGELPLEENEQLAFSERFVAYMLTGPAWCKQVLLEQDRFIKDDLAGTLRQFVELVASGKPRPSRP